MLARPNFGIGRELGAGGRNGRLLSLGCDGHASGNRIERVHSERVTRAWFAPPGQVRILLHRLVQVARFPRGPPLRARMGVHRNDWLWLVHVDTGQVLIEVSPWLRYILGEPIPVMVNSPSLIPLG